MKREDKLKKDGSRTEVKREEGNEYVKKKRQAGEEKRKSQRRD